MVSQRDVSPLRLCRQRRHVPQDLVHVARGSAALSASARPPYALPTLTLRAGFRARGHASVRTHEERAW